MRAANRSTGAELLFRVERCGVNLAGSLHAFSKGHRLGPYEILDLVGKGFDERFEREARAIAALNHPNICQVYDVGPDYLVMELVEGPTLQERIKEGAIPLDEALQLAEQIAEALAAAHEKLITRAAPSCPCRLC